MATIKSYTDLQQSKNLAEFLPLESADNYYSWHDKRYYVVNKDCPYPYSLKEKIPCWSLAALLSVLPRSITKYIDNEKCQKTFHLNLFRSYYYCCSYCFAPSISDDDGDNTLYCVGRDNWIDACYEMILKLHELNLL